MKKKEKMISKVDLNHKGENYELRFFKSDINFFLQFCKIVVHMVIVFP